MNRWIRILSIVAIASLLTWLYVSPGSYKQRVREINLLLSQKRFPELSVSQQRDLDSIINTTARVSGLKQKVFINQPFDVADVADNGLHFFVTDHQTSSITNCEQGNAVYDAVIKTVFIDISLLRSSDWMSYAPQVGFEILEEDMPFLKVYLAYVLLHELGHHELGHGSAGNLSYQNKGDREFRQKEKDADRYAFNIFGKLLQANPMVRKKADGIIEITLDNATPQEHAAIAILYMAETILLCMQFGLSPYSQYYSDDAHPTYLERINGVAEEIASLPDIRPDIVAKARRLQKTITVTQSLLDRYDIAEITLNDGMLDAAFYPDGVRFISTKFNGYTQIPFTKVRQHAGAGLWQYSEQPADLIPFKAPLDSSADIILFSLKDAGTYCLEKGTDRLYAVEKNVFRKLPTDTFGRAFETPGTLVYGSMPSPYVYVLAGGQLKSISAKAVATIAQKQIEQSIADRFHLSSVELDDLHPLPNGRFLGIGFKAKQDTIERLGLVILEGESLAVRKSVLFNLPDNFFAANTYDNHFNGGENLLLFSQKAALDVYVTTVEKTGEVNTSWLLWKIDQQGSPRFLKRIEFLTKDIGREKWNRSTSPYMYKQKVSSIGNDMFIANWNSDLCYLLDLRTESVSPAFYPGDEEQKFKGGGDGKALYFILGTKRCFLIDYNKNK